MDPGVTQTDVVVVGGGIAGLTAVCFLVRDGVRVTLFEKAPILGGHAATREFDGFLFNRGIHALYTGGATSRTLEELGVTYGHGIPKETFVLDGGNLRPFPTTPSEFLRTDLLDRAQPGWRDLLIRRQYLPRIEAVGALPTAATGGFAGRPGHRVPGIDHLYVAGDWVGPEGFLADASLASARRAAWLALEDGAVEREEISAGAAH